MFKTTPKKQHSNLSSPTPLGPGTIYIYIYDDDDVYCLLLKNNTQTRISIMPNLKQKSWADPKE